MRSHEIGKKIVHPTWSRRPLCPYWTQNRAGVIPYKVIDGKVMFLFAHHIKENTLVDFSSFVKTVDRTPEGTLIRAIKDKSFDLLKLNENILNHYSTLYLQDSCSLITFVNIDLLLSNNCSIEQLHEHFNILNNDGRMQKYSHLDWIDDDTLISIITKETPVIRRQVRCLIRDISKIIPILAKL